MLYANMNRNTLLATVLTVGLTLIAGASGALAQSSDASAKLFKLFGDEVIARGDGFEIKRGTLDESAVTLRSTIASQRNVSPNAMQEMEREVMRRLINIQLLMQLATEEDLAEGAEEADRRIASLIEQAGSETALSRQMVAVGLSLDRLRTKLEEEITAQIVLQRELEIEVTEAQITQFYEDNAEDQFTQPEMVRAAHILLLTRNPQTNQELPVDARDAKRQKIEGLLKRARDGADFAELAVQYSEDPVSKKTGGEITFPRGQQVPPEFEAAAFSLAPGQVSDVVTTALGFHIIKLYERIPTTKIEMDEALREKITKFLRTQETEELMDPFMATLAAKANVEILDPRLRPVEEDSKPTSSE